MWSLSENQISFGPDNIEGAPNGTKGLADFQIIIWLHTICICVYIYMIKLLKRSCMLREAEAEKSGLVELERPGNGEFPLAYRNCLGKKSRKAPSAAGVVVAVLSSSSSLY